MPANNTWWLWHCLARETGKLGHLYSPGAQTGPWPWFPYALDNGAFACWNPADNSFDDDKWDTTEIKWRHLLFWVSCQKQKPLWAIVPDRPGSDTLTFEKWNKFAAELQSTGIPLALAVQDGMSVHSVQQLSPQPAVIAIGGTDEFKWGTVEMWVDAFPRIHLLRCNSPAKLDYLADMRVESCDGTGWNRGSAAQVEGLERFLRKGSCKGSKEWLHKNINRGHKDKRQMSFA